MIVIYFINLIVTIFVIYLVHVGNNNCQIFIQLNQQNICHSFYRFSVSSYNKILFTWLRIDNNNCNSYHQFIVKLVYFWLIIIIRYFVILIVIIFVLRLIHINKMNAKY